MDGTRRTCDIAELRPWRRRLTEGVLAAINHSGDSDSTGSITGNLLGAAFGDDALPDQRVSGLEAVDLISTVADDLADAALGTEFIDLVRYPTW